MKERPILFSAPMVRAILQGKKTQTRRVVNRINGLGAVTCFGGSETTGYDFALRDRRDMWNEFREDELLARCPYGVAGDRLWVRETWAPCRNVIDGETEAVHKAGPWRNENEPSLKWKPSIHMPRWASRITLEVVAVRVEQLQNIAGRDAKAEGCSPDWKALEEATCDKEGWDEPEEFDEECEVEFDWVNYGRRLVKTHEHKEWEADRTNYALRLAFRRLWESINGAESWAANPWVWVVEFRKLDGGAA